MSKLSVPAQRTHTVIERLQPFVEQKEVSGAVVLVARNGKILEYDATGVADVKTKRPMRKDDIFWVASMTKPIVSAAIMTLSDEGKLSVDDPVEKHLPEFKGMWLVAKKSNDRIVLERPKKLLTLRHLLAHMDGLTDVPVPHAETPLAEWVAEVGRHPLQFEPGTKWTYNNAGMNTLGRIVDVVSGQSLPEFFQKRFFRPLGMTETTFVLSSQQLKGLAVSYEVTDGKFKPVTISILKSAYTDKRLTICPGGGLFSTAPDMFRFYQMLANGGIYAGRRYLSKAAFKNLTTPQTGEMETGFTEGMAFGLGVGMVRKPVGSTARFSIGTFGHGGAYGTQAWIDPAHDLLMILLVQRSNFGNADAGSFRHEFNRAVMDLVEGDAKS
jgi:CubicO group peptidase (beta-lactamase class C family)